MIKILRMKKVVFFILAMVGVVGAHAQNINPEYDQEPSGKLFPPKEIHEHQHGFLSRVCIDVNHTYGREIKNLSSINLVSKYTDPLNTNISGMKFSNGYSYGVDAEIGYYFDLAGRYGIGTGLMYFYQTGQLTMDKFHIEYKSVDAFNNIFRQSVTSTGQIKETLATSNINIPILFKYKISFSEKLGFNTDAGILINIVESNHYKTNAAFDYEAIYQYRGVQGNLVPVYDYQSTPAAGDLLMTRGAYPAATVQSYFNSLRAQGYNVGLGVKPNSTSGNVQDIKGSIGLLIRPSFSYSFTEHFAVNLGAYYMVQSFRNNPPVNYRITDNVGQYDPMVNSITRSNENSYGINIGASFNFHHRHHLSIIPVADTSSVPFDEDGAEDLSPAPKSGSNYHSRIHAVKESLPVQGEAMYTDDQIGLYGLAKK